MYTCGRMRSKQHTHRRAERRKQTSRQNNLWSVRIAAETLPMLQNMWYAYPECLAR